MSYQARSRRAEAYVNVRAIASAQKSHFAEKNTYHDSGNAYPAGAGLGTVKQAWDADSQTHFDALGWKPEGSVIYAYESNTTDNCGGCPLCFTITAYGDADSDSLTSAVMYVQPNVTGGVTSVCGAKLLGLGTPTRKNGSAPVYNEVAVNRQTDEF
jgi:type II secretory pathway pseudopilin PulG